MTFGKSKRKSDVLLCPRGGCQTWIPSVVSEATQPMLDLPIGHDVPITVQRPTAPLLRTSPSAPIPSCLHELPNEQLHREMQVIAS